MNLTAVRDDGAQLFTDGAAGVVVSGDNAWFTPQNSALARGNWTPASGAVPDDVERRLGMRLAVNRRDLERQAARLHPK